MKLASLISNMMRTRKGPVRGHIELEFLGLSNNVCGEMNENFLINLTSLQSFNLTTNFLAPW